MRYLLPVLFLLACGPGDPAGPDACVAFTAEIDPGCVEPTGSAGVSAGEWLLSGAPSNADPDGCASGVGIVVCVRDGQTVDVLMPGELTPVRAAFGEGGRVGPFSTETALVCDLNWEAAGGTVSIATCGCAASYSLTATQTSVGTCPSFQ